MSETQTLTTVEMDVDLGAKAGCNGIRLRPQGERSTCPNAAAWRGTVTCCERTRLVLACHVHRAYRDVNGTACLFCLELMNVTWRPL